MKPLFNLLFVLVLWQLAFANYDYIFSDVEILERNAEEDCAINRFPEREEVDVELYSFAVHISVHTFVADFWCSGTIIASTFVVTAADCLIDKGEILPKSAVGVYAYDASLNLFGSRKVEVTGIIIHRDHRVISDLDGHHLYNNIALVQVETQFDDSMIVCMPYGTSLYWNFFEASLVSWGAICPPEETNATDSLFSNAHTLRISNYTLTDPCLERIHHLSTLFCSPNHDVTGRYAPICSGDRGGSLILFQDKNVAPLIIGLVSDTLRVEGCGAPFQMVSYTKINEYFQWIYSFVGNSGKLCLRHVKSGLEEENLPK